MKKYKIKKYLSDKKLDQLLTDILLILSPGLDNDDVEKAMDRWNKDGLKNAGFAAKELIERRVFSGETK